MSSLISQSLAEQEAAIVAAVAAVAENSLFAFADLSTPELFAASLETPAADGWLQAVVHFSGPVDGQFGVTLPAALAGRLCAAFAGEEADAVSGADIVDFSGELANMICGTWLTRACDTGVFDLTPPAVVRGDTAPAAQLDSAYLAIDDVPVRIDAGWSVAGGVVAPS